MTEDVKTDDAQDVAQPAGEAAQNDQAAEAVVDGGNVLDAPEKDDAPKGDWPDDWREKFADGDEKLLKRLSRFQSPKNVLSAWRALEQRMSSGELKQELPQDASDEQVAEWRKANGIPENAEGYLDGLPDGLIIGDDDKPAIKSFAERMHAANVPPAVVHQALDWWHSERERTAEEQSKSDRLARESAEEELRAEWGTEFAANRNALRNYLAATPQVEDGVTVGDMLAGARAADGTPLMNSAPVLKWLMATVSELNPVATVIPGGQGSIETVESRIDEIKKTMRDDPKKYASENMRAELMKLYAAQEKISARAS